MTAATRGLGLVRVAVGLVWLAGLAKGRGPAGGRLSRVDRAAATVLAVRDVAQGALLVGRPRRTSVEVGAALDAVHALSMLPVLAFMPRYRKSALVSAAAALAWIGAAGALLRGHGHKRDPAAVPTRSLSSARLSSAR